tara:strand:+ start:17 stop:505 length:489 start_codon:yes stop_codon:yes gene_type:complete
MDKSRKRIAQDYARNAIVDGNTKAGRYEKKMAVKEAAGEGPKMYGKKEKGPKTFEGGAHRGEMKHSKDGSHLGPKMYGKKEKGPKTFEGGAHRGEMKHSKDGSHLGPKMYGAHKEKGAKMYGKDHGPKMTSDPQSYRSSIAQHWHKENLLTENPIARRAAGK